MGMVGSGQWAVGSGQWAVERSKCRQFEEQNRPSGRNFESISRIEIEIGFSPSPCDDYDFDFDSFVPTGDAVDRSPITAHRLFLRVRSTRP